MELKKLIRKRIEENVPDYDITKVERYEYLFEMIAIEFATEQVKLFRQPDVCKHRHIMHINSEIGWLCLECRKFSNDKQTFR